ncbi:uracil-DNA glycosylase [Bacillus testis]|uniref:uracil-DNA glycosylase n=1 Tax=Bacillus testis TaxID=1622072 RepID=UPI00067EE0ED|nr:uracil-DNA glycosylase [Bacillus testis]
MLLPHYIHSSWKPFLTEEIVDELKQIEAQIGDNYNPVDRDKVLRFLETDLSRVKVIWLGQDVYPAKGVATGRAFEVGNMESWFQPFRQVSLKNIIRLLHKDQQNIEEYKEIKSFQQIKEEMLEGRFTISEPHQWFDCLEKQGVLFLNTSYTCEIGKPNSHRAIWETFSQQVMSYISAFNPKIVWFLWGREAQSNKAFIKEGIFYESRHPMMCSAKYEDDFLKFSGFKETANKINWLC